MFDLLATSIIQGGIVIYLHCFNERERAFEKRFRDIQEQLRIYSDGFARGAEWEARRFEEHFAEFCALREDMRRHDDVAGDER